ncbi:MAG TPA: heparan-alpha-glucosaminide N-acetyltransferase domain-containing protein [Candidatus Solibacter sp.]|nr:heparan-alpha-glucosaminide N-acetyltransferase domain-containing protein [Candidatus Solibacter sp.]
MNPPAAQSRLAYIDWMRGLACVLMFQTHCYDSWLNPSARQSTFFMYSQLGGTFPAPLFLFLAGISFALVTEKLWQKNLPPAQIAVTTIRRGAEIFGFGLLFRLQEFAISWGWAPISDLFRVDILNTIGLSMILMGAMCWIVGSLWSGLKRTVGAPSLPRSVRQGWETMPRTALVLAAIATSLAISLLTPLLWTTWRPSFLPWPVESYINGVHNLGTPQPWLFPIFPWTAFAFAGLAVGFLLQSPWSRARGASPFLWLGGAGVVLILLSRWFDRMSFQLYPVYDYWHTSPNFFLLRVGMLGMILAGCYVWCRWGLAQWGFSPLILLGQESLLVYWVHIEFVYGRVSILPKHSQSIRGATLGLLTITLAMLGLAWLRRNSRKWLARLRRPISSAGDVHIPN